MASQFTEPRAGPLPSGCGGRAQDFPHGVITPPEPVHAIVQREKAKAAAVAFAEEAWQRMTDELTLQYYFESAGHDVLYRSTPQGPEVLAVGFDEIQAFTKNLALEEQLKLQYWMP